MIVTMPAITKLIPKNLNPSVNEFTIISMSINAAPKKNIIAPAVKNALNNGNSLFSAISFHHKHSNW
jgi:hypothetical protein